MVEEFVMHINEFEDYPDRKVYVYLPNNYDYCDNHYPALYMYDGQNAFFDYEATYGKSWGIKDYMDYTDGQMIIVAVECNQGPNNGRMSEYAPFDYQDDYLGSVKGQGEATMNWFVNVLKKRIDESYRTLADRDNTYIAGSSMGGLMAIYTLIKYNDVFSKAAALSPSFSYNPEALKELIINTKINKNTHLYMDKGENEVAGRFASLKSFSFFSSLLMCKKIKVTSRIVPDGHHSEATWQKQVPFFMQVLNYRGE